MIRVLTADELKDLAGDQIDAGLGSIETLHGCLPLTALDVDVRIEGLASKTTLHQQFRNVFDEPLEATYIFPLPPRGAVTGFRMMVNDTVIEGRIDERGKAREDYDTAIAEGRTASIAEQERADIFTLRVGNIPPRATARVELILVAPVAVDSLEATYRFPLVVAPRYCPGVAIDGDPVGDGIAADTDLVPDASRISPPVLLPGFKSPVELGIRVRIDAGMMAKAQGSASLGCALPATENRDADGSLTVTVVPGQHLDRDFILRWSIAANAVATTTLFVEPDTARPAGLGTGKPAEEAPGDGTFSLVIVPPVQTADVQQVPRDVVFVLDRSGSMGGWKMVAARRAVARIVDTLTSVDRVAVLAFDTSVEQCGDTPQLAPATDRHRWAVLEWLGGIEARGGTELSAALKAGFGIFSEQGSTAPARDPAAQRDRMFVLVTDGQVGDEDRVVANLINDIGDVTLFVVGIDTAVNEGLLNRMAESTGGMVEMVESEDRLDDVMDRIHIRLAMPLVSGLDIRSAGLDIIHESLVPARLPNLVPGVPLVISGRYRGTPTGGVSIEGRRPAGESWQEQVPATAASSGCQSSLWARGRLRHLEDLYAKRHHNGNEAALESRIVELSTAFGVLCRFTAVVAIDPRAPDRKPDRAPTRRIIQPVEQFMQHQMAAFSPAIHGVVNTTYSFHGRAHYFSSEDDDPLNDVRMRAVDILIKACPKSGAFRDVKATAIRKLLKAALALLKELGECGALRAMIESLATAHGRLYALPADQAALVAMLDVLADIAEANGTVARWWQGAQVDTSTDDASSACSAVDDIPF